MTNVAPDRRSLLLAGGAGLALSTSPRWVSAAFAAQGASTRAPAEGGAVKRALEKAGEVGKPLLVLVVPDESLRFERGRLWGDLFAYASEDSMADFALCEWTCASAAELARALPELKDEFAREVAAVLVETDGVAPRTRPIAFPLGDLAPTLPDGFPLTEMWKRARQLATQLQDAILPGADAGKRRMDQSLLSRSPTANDIPYPLQKHVRPRLGPIDRYAALVRFRDGRFPQGRALCTSLLAQAATRRLWDQDLAGGAWRAEHFDSCPSCGMSLTGLDSRTFLDFYIAEKR